MQAALVLSAALVGLVIVATIAVMAVTALVSLVAVVVVTSRVDHVRSDAIEQSLLSSSID